MLDLLTTPSFREAVVRGSGRRDDGAVARALADLGSAQTRLESLDDDYYVRGVLAPHQYRSIRAGWSGRSNGSMRWSTERGGSALSCTPTRDGCGRRLTSASDGSSSA
jgi:hypothetical protein